MALRENTQHPSIRLADYEPPAWRVESIDMQFDLGIRETHLYTTLKLEQTHEGQLELDGIDLELVSIALDGESLPADDYHYDHAKLVIPGASGKCTLKTHVRLDPAANTQLEGLYLSGNEDSGFLLTQCEPQGFRHITFMLDRPDVQSKYSITLQADKKRFPVLLAGGDPSGEGELEGGKHWARFIDPHPKPTYLFAIVAGQLEKISQPYTTAEGREVTLNLWSQADAIEQCHFAMQSLQNAMRWDEKTYGRNYDLDVFHVVATHDFNMGAMENKGLNIFNTSCLLADVETSTDSEFRRVESVVAHEYFHNWSGNRVTCRDWFQLSLKEGFTVFREHSFSAYMNSEALKRIEDVAFLRAHQFSEDASPLAHSVRPDAYREINNFYTTTIYEKGAELVRMLAGSLGEKGFRKGTDLYFARHDGESATIEDFLNALGDANHVDLSPYLAWYGQAGTPRISARGDYDDKQKSYTLTFTQHTPKTPGQDSKLPVPIPIKLALFAEDGARLDLQLGDETAAQGHERTIILDSETQSFTFNHVDTQPIPSLLRDLSAPVILDYSYSPEQLALLIRHDSDGFNRWDASQTLAALAYDAIRRESDDATAVRVWLKALGELFYDKDMDKALLATLLTPPGEDMLAKRDPQNDPDKVHAAREHLLQRLAEHIGSDALCQQYQHLRAPGDTSMDAQAQAKRSLKNRVLDLLARTDVAYATQAARAQYQDAQCMSDRMGALFILLLLESGEAESDDFRQRFEHNPLVINKWFSAHARIPGEESLECVQNLLQDPDFTLRNPNRARAVLGVWAQGNPSGFHRADGKGYALLKDKILEIDKLNPQVAARIATAFNSWQSLEPVRKQAVKGVLADILANPKASENLKDIVERAMRD